MAIGNEQESNKVLLCMNSGRMGTYIRQEKDPNDKNYVVIFWKRKWRHPFDFGAMRERKYPEKVHRDHIIEKSMPAGESIEEEWFIIHNPNDAYSLVGSVFKHKDSIIREQKDEISQQRKQIRNLKNTASQALESSEKQLSKIRDMSGSKGRTEPDYRDRARSYLDAFDH